MIDRWIAVVLVLTLAGAGGYGTLYAWRNGKDALGSVCFYACLAALFMLAALVLGYDRASAAGSLS